MHRRQRTANMLAAAWTILGAFMAYIFDRFMDGAGFYHFDPEHVSHYHYLISAKRMAITVLVGAAVGACVYWAYDALANRRRPVIEQRWTLTDMFIFVYCAAVVIFIVQTVVRMLNVEP